VGEYLGNLENSAITEARSKGCSKRTRVINYKKKLIAALVSIDLFK